MTVNGVRIWIAEEKSLAGVRRINAKMLDSQRVCYLGAFLAGLLAVLIARRLEVEAAILVLLIVWRVGARIMRSNGKSRIDWVLE